MTWDPPRAVRTRARRPRVNLGSAPRTSPFSVSQYADMSCTQIVPHMSWVSIERVLVEAFRTTATRL